MSMTPEVRVVLEDRIGALRGAAEGLGKLIDAAVEDASLSTRLAAVMGDRWVSILVCAEGAAEDGAVGVEFELGRRAGADEPKGDAS